MPGRSEVVAVSVHRLAVLMAAAGISFQWEIIDFFEWEIVDFFEWEIIDFF